MAYETIGNFKIYDWEQEEISEQKQVAGADGIVSTVTEVFQEYVHVWAEVIVKQELQSIENNQSKIGAELWIHCTAGEEGDGVTLVFNHSSYLKLDNIYKSDKQPNIGDKDNLGRYIIDVLPGKTYSQKIREFNIKGASLNNVVNNTGDSKVAHAYHNLDGSLSHILINDYTSVTGNTVPLCFNAFIEWNTRARTMVNGTSLANRQTTHDVTSDYLIPTPLSFDRKTNPISAIDFTDEENPYFIYTATTGVSYSETQTSGYGCYINDTISLLQVGIGFADDGYDNIKYREIPIESSSYTLVLTNSEREALRQYAKNSTFVPIYYLVKTIRKIPAQTVRSNRGHEYNVSEQIEEFVSITKRTLTIVGAEPSLNPTVRDVNSDTLALTGNENIIVKYESMAEYEFNATPSKNAEIVSYSVQCGSNVISDLPQGVIQDTESGSFIFNVRDSRNLSTQTVVSKSFVEYVKPTCYQKLEIELAGDVGATVSLNVSGTYFNGSFGAADNTLKLEVRYGPDEDELGEWITLTDTITPVFKNNSYELKTTITGFGYTGSYIFQCRATDKLNIVQSSQYTIKLLPVFDWGEEDFNFNVPVNIDSDTLDMHGATVLRHGKDTKNTVLSANGGHIYIRPGGTEKTSGETIIYPDGSVAFSSVVDFNKSINIGGNAVADFVIESGSESMGSNGTWEWRKWKSGKAECWGCRNFGSMAVTTAWGNLYRGSILTQDLPEDLFARTPDVISINIVHGNYGGWICKHEQTAPSAITTGSFIFVRPASATVSPSATLSLEP